MIWQMFYIFTFSLSLTEMTSKYFHRCRNRIIMITQLLNRSSTTITNTKMIYMAMLF